MCSSSSPAARRTESSGPLQPDPECAHCIAACLSKQAADRLPRSWATRPVQRIERLWQIHDGLGVLVLVLDLDRSWPVSEEQHYLHIAIASAAQRPEPHR